LWSGILSVSSIQIIFVWFAITSMRESTEMDKTSDKIYNQEKKEK
jgi:hypothetical protein